MTEWKIDEHQLHHLNSVLQRSDQVLLWNCITRTAQESVLFPVMPYLMSTFIDSYYRYPDILRKASAHIEPEVCGRRAREVSCKLSKLTAWSALNYYINGRSLLINFGLLRPEDNLEDLVFMVDWYERFALSYHRQSSHLYTRESGDVAQELPERTVQVLETDAYATSSDSRLREAARRFTAVLTQYNFLAHAESRTGLHNSGPYRLSEGHVLITRDFSNMAECELPWMDGIGVDVPYNNLTLALVLKDVEVEVTDWGSLYTVPEQIEDRVIAVGLYTSDWLSDRYLPVGMDSVADLVDTLSAITSTVQRATNELYRKLSAMTWQQMIHAGMLTYFQSSSDVAHMAGTYEQSDWDFVDYRTQRLLTIMNEEYARDAYVDKFVLMSGRHAAQSEYFVHPISKTCSRGGFLVPEGVLNDHDYPRRVNQNGLADCAGTSSLPPKTGKFTTTAGRLSESEANDAARRSTSPLTEGPWAHIDDHWVKYRSNDADVQELYRYSQERSRLLSGRGSTLCRTDLMTIRRDAGEPTW